MRRYLAPALVLALLLAALATPYVLYLTRW